MSSTVIRTDFAAYEGLSALDKITCMSTCYCYGSKFSLCRTAVSEAEYYTRYVNITTKLQLE